MACACGCGGKCGSSCPGTLVRVQVARVVRLPIVPVGELRGLIYRARRRPGDVARTYVHFFKGRLPVLATNPAGTQLYMTGGQYRVTGTGIHG